MCVCIIEITLADYLNMFLFIPTSKFGFLLYRNIWFPHCASQRLGSHAGAIIWQT